MKGRMLMWGRMVSCGRVALGLAASEQMPPRPSATRPQVENLPHKLRAFLLLLAAPLFAAERPISFRLDVMPVFFRAGCNSGGCHGAAIGKDGFHLSLFGYDPAGDYCRLTQQIVGRRIDLAVPEAEPAAPEGHRRGAPQRRPPLQDRQRILPHAPALDSGRRSRRRRPMSRRSPASPSCPIRSSSPARSRPRRCRSIAKYSDGTSRAVNDLALYLTNNKSHRRYRRSRRGHRRANAATRLSSRASPSTPPARRSIVLPPGQDSSGPRSPRPATSTSWSTPS